MLIKAFSVASTNIFPIANSTKGGQLVTEWNLRTKDSVGYGPYKSDGAVNYVSGPSFVHSENDYVVDMYRDGVGSVISPSTISIGPGRAVVNGHFVENLETIVIDIQSANARAITHEEGYGDKVGGNLAIGLKAFYSTDSTTMGSMLAEKSSNGIEYYEGIQVVILPESQFITPLDIDPTTHKTYSADQVTAHIRLATFEYSNGVGSKIVNGQREYSINNDLPDKYKFISSDRVFSAGSSSSDGYVSTQGLDPKKMYVLDGVGTGTDSQGNTFTAWDDVTSALMMWDANPATVDLGTDPNGNIREAVFSRVNNSQTSEEELALVLPHKQIRFSQPLTDPAWGNAKRFYQSKVYRIPNADYGRKKAGVVNKRFIENLQSDIVNKIKGTFHYGISGDAKMIAYLPILDKDPSRGDALKATDENGNTIGYPFENIELKNYTVGDYFLVGNDLTISDTEGRNITNSAGISTIYVITPGMVEEVSFKGSVYHNGITEPDPYFPTGVAGIELVDKDGKGTLPITATGADQSTQFGLPDTPYGSTLNENYMVWTYNCAEGLENKRAIRHYTQGTTVSFQTGDTFSYYAAIEGYTPPSPNPLNSLVGSFRLDVIGPPTSPTTINLLYDDGIIINDSNHTDGIYTSLVQYNQENDITTKFAEINHSTRQVTFTANYSRDLADTGLTTLNLNAYWKYSGKIKFYYVPSKVKGDIGVSKPVVINPPIPLAEVDLIGGFLNVDPSIVGKGYVWRNEDGVLQLVDYELLSNGLLVWQLGEDKDIRTDLGAGIALSEVQEYLDANVNDRIAFPNANQITKINEYNTQNPDNAKSVYEINIYIPINKAADGTRERLEVRNIDSRFGTHVHLHFISGTGLSNQTEIVIINCEKTRITFDGELLTPASYNEYGESPSTPVIALSNSSLYYDVETLARLDVITGLSLWYERFKDEDPNIQVNGMTVRNLYPPTVTDGVGGVTGDNYEFRDQTATNDAKYLMALRSLTFDNNGIIVGAAIAIRNGTTANNLTDEYYAFTASFELPQGGVNLRYPINKLRNPVKFNGSFIAAYPNEYPAQSGYRLMDTKFSAESQVYDLASNIAVNSGTIGVLEHILNVHKVEGLSLDVDVSVWDTNGWNEFSGVAVATPFNTTNYTVNGS